MTFPATLVLGASGRIGRLLQCCWPERADIRWQIRRPPSSPPPAQGWLHLDPLADPAGLMTAAREAEVILCLAGPIPGRDGDLADNIALGEATVRAGAAGGARVLLASSAAVYGAQGGHLAETTPLQPANDYGRAKAEMEQRALALGQELGVAVTLLRIGNIAGFDAILGGWKPGFRLDRFADGQSPRRSYIGLSRLAAVLAALVRQPDLPSVLNLAQPGVVDMGALLRAAGRDFTPQPAPATAIPEVALEVRRLLSLLPKDVDLPAAVPEDLVADWQAITPRL